MTRMTSVVIALVSMFATVGDAQRASQAGPPVRPLGGIIATSSAPIGGIAQVLVLSDGRLLVNDNVGRRVVLLDSTLKHATSIIDTTGETRRAYGEPNGQHLFAYYGDSSLFLDLASGALVVIDPSGAIVRVMAAPVDPRAPWWGSQFISVPTVVSDRRGHFIIHRQTGQRPHDIDSLLAVTATERSLARDTVFTVDRIDIRDARDDTIAFLTMNAAYRASSGRFLFSPLVEADQETILSDGTLAIVRAHDYHVDWVASDGQVTSSPPIAHRWVRLTDSLKIAFLDSARAAGSLRTEQTLAGQGGIEAVAKAWQMNAAGQRPPSDSERLAAVRAAYFLSYVPAELLPDYVPAFSPMAMAGFAAVRADADDELWISLTDVRASDEGQVYEIVNRQGVLVDRVQVPGGTSIVGFGPGVVYLAARVGTGMQIARARIR